MGNTVKKAFFMTTSVTIPAKVTSIGVETLKYPGNQIGNNVGPTFITVGAVGPMFLDTFGNGWSSGANTASLMGNGTITAAFSSPQMVLGGLTFVSLVGSGTSNYGITNTGDGFAWGDNTKGQLGVGSAVAKSFPTAITGGLKFKKICIHGNSAFGITPNGVGWSWGLNTSGSLGDGTVVAKSSPVSILGGLLFVDIMGSGGATNQMLALTASGQAFSWGSGTAGALGLGDVTPRSSPVAVLGGHTFSRCPQSVASSSFGLDTNNVLWSWGANLNGQLGLGDVTARSSPVQVLGGLSFVKVYPFAATAIFAITQGGVVYGWGGNSSGELGVGDVTPHSSPIAVLGGHKFRMLAMSGFTDQTVYGITFDNDLYAWGTSGSGGLGDGTVVSKSSPVVVLGGLKWAWVWTGGGSIAGNSSAFGVTVDGDVYSWGNNDNGQLGVGDVTPRSSPVLLLGGHRMQPITSIQHRNLPVTPNTTYNLIMNDQYVKFGNEIICGDQGADQVNIYYQF